MVIKWFIILYSLLFTITVNSHASTEESKLWRNNILLPEGCSAWGRQWLFSRIQMYRKKRPLAFIFLQKGFELEPVSVAFSVLSAENLRSWSDYSNARRLGKEVCKESGCCSWSGSPCFYNNKPLIVAAELVSSRIVIVADVARIDWQIGYGHFFSSFLLQENWIISLSMKSYTSVLKPYLYIILLQVFIPLLLTRHS